MELRQNWHKFQRLLGHLPPKKKGLVVLQSNQKILAGAVGAPADQPLHAGFSDAGMPSEHVESAWETLSHKYGASGATFLEREALLEALGQIAAVRTVAPATDNFHAQLTKLRELLSVEKGSKLASHLGDKPVESFWPREHFLLGFFRSFFSELLPERKLLLLCVVKGPGDMDSLLLEFQGSELKGFCDPDFSGFDWKSSDLFLPETAERFVLWCENHYMLPAYSLFLTERVWQECRDFQATQGNRQAWRHILKIRAQRDVEKEVLLSPEPWPVKALLRWNSLRA